MFINDMSKCPFYENMSTKDLPDLSIKKSDSVTRLLKFLVIYERSGHISNGSGCILTGCICPIVTYD